MARCGSDPSDCSAILRRVACYKLLYFHGFFFDEREKGQLSDGEKKEKTNSMREILILWMRRSGPTDCPAIWCLFGGRIATLTTFCPASHLDRAGGDRGSKANLQPPACVDNQSWPCPGQGRDTCPECN